MFYLIDKPIGISSFDVIRRLRKSLNIRKMGHAGTLDPLATGLLIIATEKSTKLLSLLDTASKEYIFTVRFDGKTDSLDMDTPLDPIDSSGFQPRTKKEIENHILSQKTQIPPLYSALHIEGNRAYDLARAGKIFEMKERNISVSEIEVLNQSDMTLTLRIILSSWWYVRSFAPLLWKYHGIDGWYISSLRRTKIYTSYGMLAIEDATDIDVLSSISYSQLFHTIPTYEIDSTMLADIRLGKALDLWSAIYYEENSLVFLFHTLSQYTSLCRYHQGICTIVRNDV